MSANNSKESEYDLAKDPHANSFRCCAQAGDSINKGTPCQGALRWCSDWHCARAVCKGHAHSTGCCQPCHKMRKRGIAILGETVSTEDSKKSRASEPSSEVATVPLEVIATLSAHGESGKAPRLHFRRPDSRLLLTTATLDTLPPPPPGCAGPGVLGVIAPTRGSPCSTVDDAARHYQDRFNMVSDTDQQLPAAAGRFSLDDEAAWMCKRTLWPAEPNSAKLDRLMLYADYPTAHAQHPQLSVLCERFRPLLLWQACVQNMLEYTTLRGISWLAIDMRCHNLLQFIDQTYRDQDHKLWLRRIALVLLSMLCKLLDCDDEPPLTVVMVCPHIALRQQLLSLMEEPNLINSRLLLEGPLTKMWSTHPVDFEHIHRRLPELLRLPADPIMRKTVDWQAEAAPSWLTPEACYPTSTTVGLPPWFLDLRHHGQPHFEAGGALQCILRADSRELWSVVAQYKQGQLQKPLHPLGWTLLHITALLGNTRCARVLLHARADPNITYCRMPQQLTALHLACSRGDYQLVELLVGSKAEPRLRDARGLTAIEHCQQPQRAQMWDYLSSSRWWEVPNKMPASYDLNGFTHTPVQVLGLRHQEYTYVLTCTGCRDRDSPQAHRRWTLTEDTAALAHLHSCPYATTRCCARGSSPDQVPCSGLFQECQLRGCTLMICTLHKLATREACCRNCAAIHDPRPTFMPTRDHPGASSRASAQQIAAAAAVPTSPLLTSSQGSSSTLSQEQQSTSTDSSQPTASSLTSSEQSRSSDGSSTDSTTAGADRRQFQELDREKAEAAYTRSHAPLRCTFEANLDWRICREELQKLGYKVHIQPHGKPYSSKVDPNICWEHNRWEVLAYRDRKDQPLVGVYARFKSKRHYAVGTYVVAINRKSYQNIGEDHLTGICQALALAHWRHLPQPTTTPHTWWHAEQAGLTKQDYEVAAPLAQLGTDNKAVPDLPQPLAASGELESSSPTNSARPERAIRVGVARMNDLDSRQQADCLGWSSLTLHEVLAEVQESRQAGITAVFSAQHGSEALSKLLGPDGLRQALQNSTLEDQNIIEAIRQLDKQMNTPQAGSAFACAIVQPPVDDGKDGPLVTVISLGDCGAMLLQSDGVNHMLAPVHEPAGTDSRRIETAGGQIQSVGGTSWLSRQDLEGKLPVSRIMGCDAWKTWCCDCYVEGQRKKVNARDLLQCPECRRQMDEDSLLVTCTPSIVQWRLSAGDTLLLYSGEMLQHASAKVLSNLIRHGSRGGPGGNVSLADHQAWERDPTAQARACVQRSRTDAVNRAAAVLHWPAETKQPQKHGGGAQPSVAPTLEAAAEKAAAEKAKKAGKDAETRAAAKARAEAEAEAEHKAKQRTEAEALQACVLSLSKAKTQRETETKAVSLWPVPESGMWRGVEILLRQPLAHGWLCISRGSVVHFEGDAIVNAAKEGCLSGGRVDAAVASAGGNELRQARKELPVLEGSNNIRCRTGDAKLTAGGELNAKWCIHAVGPSYIVIYDHGKDISEGDALLAQAYTRTPGAWSWAAPTDRWSPSLSHFCRPASFAAVAHCWMFYGSGWRPSAHQRTPACARCISSPSPTTRSRRYWKLLQKQRLRPTLTAVVVSPRQTPFDAPRQARR